jgi:site-specific recombinase XerD
MKRQWSGFKSPLANTIELFLQHKRALRKKFHTEERALQLFDRYLVERGIASTEQVTAEVLDCFLASRTRTRPRSYNHLVGVLRRLFEWMVGQEIVVVSPLRAVLRRAAVQLKPHILKHDEVKQILILAEQLNDAPNAMNRGKTYQLIFALIYGLGLRVGEIARLKMGDVDFEKNVLIVKETKFSKTRLVPMGPRLAHCLTTYIKKTGAELLESDPVFWFRGKKRRPINPCTISQVYHQLVLRLQIRAEEGEIAPRLHDLRHSFAVNTLLRWYQDGAEPSQRLFSLSVFMGHVNLESTAVYLTITNDLLTEANHRFHRFAEATLKEEKL